MNIKRGIYIVLLSLVTLIIIASGSCSPGAQTPAADQGNSTNKPGVIKSWQGNETKKTEVFTITRNLWEIRWSNDPQVEGTNKEAMFRVYVHNVKLGSFPIYIAANTNTKGSGTYEIHDEGQFYLQIDAANTKWTVEVIQK